MSQESLNSHTSGSLHTQTKQINQPNHTKYVWLREIIKARNPTVLWFNKKASRYRVATLSVTSVSTHRSGSLERITLGKDTPPTTLRVPFIRSPEPLCGTQRSVVSFNSKGHRLQWTLHSLTGFLHCKETVQMDLRSSVDLTLWPNWCDSSRKRNKKEYYVKKKEKVHVSFIFMRIYKTY